MSFLKTNCVFDQNCEFVFNNFLNCGKGTYKPIRYIRSSIIFCVVILSNFLHVYWSISINVYTHYYLSSLSKRQLSPSLFKTSINSSELISGYHPNQTSRTLYSSAAQRRDYAALLSFVGRQFKFRFDWANFVAEFLELSKINSRKLWLDILQHATKEMNYSELPLAFKYIKRSFKFLWFYVYFLSKIYCNG